jgi:phage-related holin
LLIDFSAILQIIWNHTIVLVPQLFHRFGILLLLLLYFIFFSYNTGLETSMKESKYKYKVAGWLQKLLVIILASK